MAELVFDDLCHMVASASGPGEVFTSLRQTAGRPREARLSALRAEYNRLLSAADPLRLHADASVEQAASVVRLRLSELFREASVEIVGDGGSSDAAFTVRTERGAYELLSPLCRGDIATLYEGRVVEGPLFGQAVVLKIVDDQADNDLALDEAKALRHLLSVEAPQHKHLPALFDQFETADHRAGLVLSKLAGRDLVTVRQRYPEGLPAEHVVWILKRTLSVLGFAHSRGVIHANVEPSHIMVRGTDHNAWLVDFSYSLIGPLGPGHRFKCRNEAYSAPEVGQKKPPLPSADLYSLGKCAIYLLGGDDGSDAVPDQVDERFARLIRFMTRTSPLQRAQDAWQLHNELGRLQQEMFGKQRFVALDV